MQFVQCLLLHVVWIDEFIDSRRAGKMPLFLLNISAAQVQDFGLDKWRLIWQHGTVRQSRLIYLSVIKFNIAPRIVYVSQQSLCATSCLGKLRTLSGRRKVSKQKETLQWERTFIKLFHASKFYYFLNRYWEEERKQ